MQTTGDTKIEVIQGDALETKLKLNGVDLAIIEGIYFSCKGLNITKKLELINGIYVLKFTPLETKNFSRFNGDYDLTIKFVDNNIKTIVYRSEMLVLPKTNEVAL